MVVLGGTAIVLSPRDPLIARATPEAVSAKLVSRLPASSATAWLNANEYPEGPPEVSVAAMAKALGESNRYHYEEFDFFYASLADSLSLKVNNVLVGAGSSEVLHCAVEAFVTHDRPYITSWPSFEAGPELASAKGYPVVKIPLRKDYSANVELLADAAARAGGGLIYLCNPNNPTSSLTSAHDIRWLSENLPPATNLIVDEAYIHFTGLRERDTALELVRSGKNVIVLRTFSKIYGMAGLRVGFAAAAPPLIKRMTPYRNNVISIIGVRAVQAALDIGPKLIEGRRARIAETRSDLVLWCCQKGIKYIEPNGNFMMIETGRDVRQVSAELAARGVMAGRPFPPYDTMIRVTIAGENEMAKFKGALAGVLSI